MCLNWGYEHLGKKIYEESIDEMKHADKLVERVLFLDGLPNLQKLNKLSIGQTVIEILKNDLALESGTVPRLNKGVQLCRDLGRQRERGAPDATSSWSPRSTSTGSSRSSSSSARSASALPGSANSLIYS